MNKINLRESFPWFGDSVAKIDDYVKTLWRLIESEKNKYSFNDWSLAELLAAIRDLQRSRDRLNLMVNALESGIVERANILLGSKPGPREEGGSDGL